VTWYICRVPAHGSAELDTVPFAQFGNVLPPGTGCTLLRGFCPPMDYKRARGCGKPTNLGVDVLKVARIGTAGLVGVASVFVVTVPQELPVEAVVQIGVPINFGPEVDRSFGDDGKVFVGDDSITAYSPLGGVFVSNGADGDSTNVTSYDDAGIEIGSTIVEGGGIVYDVDRQGRAIVGTSGGRLFRILPDGNRDSTFRNGLGAFPQPPGPDPSGYVLLDVQTDGAGQAYVAFRATDWNPGDVYVTRANGAGLFSTGFGASGWVNVGNMREMRVDSGGRLVVSTATAGSNGPFSSADSYEVNRWRTNGSADPTFNVITATAPSSRLHFSLLTDGTIVTEQDVADGQNYDLILRSVYDDSGEIGSTSTFESYNSRLHEAPGAKFYRTGPASELYQLIDNGGNETAFAESTGATITVGGAQVHVQYLDGVHASGQLGVIVFDYSNDRTYLTRFNYRSSGPAPAPIPVAGGSVRTAFTGSNVLFDVTVPGPPYLNLTGIVTSGPHAGTKFTCYFACRSVSRLGYAGTVVGTDRVVIFDDANGNNRRDASERATILLVRWFDDVAYSALGDSYSSGEGLAGRQAVEEDWFPGTPSTPRCHRSELAYGPQLSVQGPGALRAVSNPDVSFDFLACTGARSFNIKRDLAAFPGLSAGDRTGTNGPSPVAVDLEPARRRQGFVLNDLEQQDEGVDLITVTMGGNDSNWSEIIKECFLDYGNSLFNDDGNSTAADCFNGLLNFPGTGVPLDDYVEARLLLVAERTRVTLLDLKAISPEATIVLAGYPYIVPGSKPEQECGKLDPAWAGDRYLSPTEQNKIRSYQDQLDVLLTEVAAEVGVHFVSVVDAFGGHEICGKDGEYLNALVVDREGADLTSLGVDEASFHPKAAGHQLYRQEIEALFAQHRAAGNFGTNGVPANPEPTFVPEGIAAPPSRGLAFASSGPVLEQVPSSTDVEFVPVAAAAPSSSCPGGDVVVAPNGSVEIVAAGFAADSVVTLTGQPHAGEDFEYGTAVADADGRLSTSVVVPAELATGYPMSIRALGATTEGTPALGRTDFMIGIGGAFCTSNDTAAVVLDTPVLIDVLSNDDPGTGAIDPNSLSVDNGTIGSVSVVAGQLEYTPPVGYVGVDFLEYSICRTDGVCSDATVEITTSANCTITGTEGDDILFGTEGDDVICGLHGSDAIDGAGGADVIVGGPGLDYLVGGDGSDRLLGGADSDTFANDPDDSIDADAGEIDELGDVYAPTVTGLVEPAANSAGWHNTPITVTWSANDREPSSGTPSTPLPSVVATEGAAIEVTSAESCDPANNCGTGSATVSIDLTAPLVTVLGVANGAVIPFGQPFPSVSCEANDTLAGLQGPCATTLELAPGSDDSWVFTSTATDRAGNTTTAVVTFTVEVEDTSDPCRALTPTIVGTNGDDLIQGTTQIDIIFGLAGNDRIVGGSGADIICGGEGNDIMFGGTQNDTLYGGLGNDAINGDSGNDTISGGEGNDIAIGGTENDTLYGDIGQDVIFGGSGVDAIYGGDSADILSGDGNDDTVDGGNGDDLINGGSGRDVLDGNAGRDIVDGAGQTDTCDDAETTRSCEIITIGAYR
jgi:Ca2+-binding RTX toxin-like protein